jgi:hypothetical protein
MKKLLVVLAFGLLAACAREPRVQSSTIDVVTVRYFEGEDSAAARKASDECSRYGRRARLRNTNANSSGERDAIFDCII